jgi:hypothetical protein
VSAAEVIKNRVRNAEKEINYEMGYMGDEEMVAYFNLPFPVATSLQLISIIHE